MKINTGQVIARATTRAVARHDQRRIAAIKKNIPEQDRLIRLAQLFAVLADPTRLKIMISMRNTELCVHEINDLAGPSLSAVSHQLRFLKAMHLVRFRKQGQEVFYTLDDDHIKKLIDLAGEHINEI
jgi:DNA-binding transcriptional ArsR family regulator